jgi:hypothetical protein
MVRPGTIVSVVGLERTWSKAVRASITLPGIRVRTQSMATQPIQPQIDRPS